MKYAIQQSLSAPRSLSLRLTSEAQKASAVTWVGLMRYRAHRSLRALGHLALMLFVAFTAAMGATAVASSPARPLEIELDQSSLLTPTHVTYEWTGGGLEVSGRIEKSRDRYGRILGRAEIDLLDAQGRVLSRHYGALQHFSPRRKDPDWAAFRTRIETVPSAAVQLRIRHTAGFQR